MERYPTDYEKTGNNIPVSSEFLLNGVLNELERYDHLVSATGNAPQFSPYTDPVIIDIDGNKQVQVPQQIQSQAIQIWTEQKSQPNMLNNEYGAAKREYEELVRNNQSVERTQPNQLQNSQELNDDLQQKVIIVEKTDNRYLYLLILVLICGAAYYYYHNKN